MTRGAGAIVDELSRIDKDMVINPGLMGGRCGFAVALYPGHLRRSDGVLDPSIRVTKQTPQTFLLQAWDDPVDPICNSTVYARA